MRGRVRKEQVKEMWKPDGTRHKLMILAGVTFVTLGIHYGWLIEPLFGHHPSWIHSVHGRFCYIPIVIAAAWFGIRGGLVMAATISLLVLPYIYGHDLSVEAMVSELVEIVFYFGFGLLIGWLVDREFKARRRQQEAQIQLERSQKLSMVGQIAAGVAHEIKNPLASIKGATDIITDDSTQPNDRKEFAGILQGEVKRIDSTVTEFLEFARPKVTRLAETDLSEVVGASLRQMEAHARHDGIRIESAIMPNIVGSFDREKIQQLLLNLILNAMDASANKTAITVSLKRTDGKAHLTVADRGRGISDEEREHIFEPFYTTKTSGSGLGLAMVQSIVEDHDGSIEVSSRPGAGATFTVILPIKKASEPS